MNHPWAIWLRREDASSLAGLRLVAGVEVGESDQHIWLRGKAGDETLRRLLLSIPAVARYELMPNLRLRVLEARIPSGRLPDIRWQPLSIWLQIESPVAALSGDVPTPAPLQLVRSDIESEPDLLLTEIEDWAQFVSHAARVRLERLHFAVNGIGQVLVRGTPLPPLPGRRYVMRSGVAVPVGFHWQPAVSVEVLARRFGITGGVIVLWQEDGSVTRLHTEQFIPATRSAVQATAKELANQR